MKKTNPMKKTKPRTKPVVAKQLAKAHKRVAKTNQAAAAARKIPSARESAGIDLLAEAIASLAAIATELRQIADDLRDLMGGPEQPELDALVITEVESPEGPEEES
jgi:fumarate hydratase class II